MAKPPPSPPSSDIEGVDRDRRRIDGAENAKNHPEHGENLARIQSSGRPADTKR